MEGEVTVPCPQSRLGGWVGVGGSGPRLRCRLVERGLVVGTVPRLRCRLGVKGAVAAEAIPCLQHTCLSQSAEVSMACQVTMSVLQSASELWLAMQDEVVRQILH